MITVTFLNGCILATAEQSLWQYSYNQQLQINGLELPGVFTVDFCNEGDTTTVAMIGSSGVVDIPNELLTSGRDIVAYVFQKSTLTGGITRCEIRIDVLTRPERDDETPTPEQEAVIDQYIAELNEGVETAETAAANAETSENNAAASAADAQQSKADAAASASAAAGSASDASNSAAAAAQSAVNASNSAEDAAEAASEGIGYKEDSEAWAIGKRGGVDVGSSDETYHNNSKYYAGQAAASSSAANSEAAAAAQSARDAAASANGAAQSAASATASKNAAANSADIAANAATAAQNHAISAASSATAAGGSATAAANKATAAAQSATAAGNSATEAATAREAAEDAQDAAEAAAQSIAQSAAQIAQNTSDIADLKDAVDTLQPAATAADVGKALIVKTVADGKPTEYEYGEAGGGGDASNYAPIIINSASGAIASFADGADGLPIKALTVNVEPIQDLHGYDSPWPAGGGKNKFNPAEAQNNKWINGTTGEIESVSGFWITGFIPVKSGDVIRSALKGSARNAWYNADKSQATYFAFNGDGSATAPSDGFVVLAVSSSTVAYGSDFIVTINNADLTFSPYSNICPISGRTSATVTRTGKNLIPFPYVSSAGTVNGVTFAINDDNSISITGTATGTTFFNLGDASHTFLLKAGTYVKTVPDTSGQVQFNIYKKNGTALAANQTTAFTIQSDEECYCRIRVSSGFSTSFPVICYPQLELGSTASAYEPYQGNTYTIQLGDTVYGGTLDVTGGKMMVDRAYKLLNDADKWITIAGTITYRYNEEISRKLYDNSYTGLTCTIAPTISNANYTARWQGSSTYYFGIADKATTPVTSLDAIKAMATAGQIAICYAIEPVEITLSPTQIDTLLGTNNVWSDAGTVDVDYRADTKLYIDNIHTPTDDDMTADAQIPSGKYFLIGGTLYKSTTVIPAGDTIRPGTNCIKTNLAEALNALNA